MKKHIITAAYGMAMAIDGLLILGLASVIAGIVII